MGSSIHSRKYSWFLPYLSGVETRSNRTTCFVVLPTIMASAYPLISQAWTTPRNKRIHDLTWHFLGGRGVASGAVLMLEENGCPGRLGPCQRGRRNKSDMDGASWGTGFIVCENGNSHVLVVRIEYMSGERGLVSPRRATIRPPYDESIDRCACTCKKRKKPIFLHLCQTHPTSIETMITQYDAHHSARDNDLLIPAPCVVKCNIYPHCLQGELRLLRTQ